MNNKPLVGNRAASIINIHSQIDVEDIAQSICDDLDQEETIELIMDIDANVGDWQFSHVLLERMLDSMYDDADGDGLEDLKKTLKDRLKEHSKKRKSLNNHLLSRASSL